MSKAFMKLFCCMDQSESLKQEREDKESANILGDLDIETSKIPNIRKG